MDALDALESDDGLAALQPEPRLVLHLQGLTHSESAAQLQEALGEAGEHGKAVPSLAALCIATRACTWEDRQEELRGLAKYGLTPVLNELVLFEYLRGPNQDVAVFTM